MPIFLVIVIVIHRESKKRWHPNHGYNFCQFLIDLQNSFTAANSSKFPTKPVLGYPPHLKYVAALPWKLKNQKFALCMHVKHVSSVIFLSSVQQISAKCHEN